MYIIIKGLNLTLHDLFVGVNFKVILKKMLKILILQNAISMVYSLSYSTCYETYCLFSFGPNVTVNNVKEAQNICKDAKHGSWLLESVDVKVSRNVNKFLSEHSFPENTKLILNVERQEGKWMWINTRAEVNNTNGFSLHHNGNITFYQPQNRTRKSNIEKDNFTILCMAGNFTKLKGKRFLYGVHYKPETMVGCLKKCENSECVAWEWDHKSGCWIHKTIKEKNMTENESGDLYILNKSMESDLGVSDEPQNGKSDSIIKLVVIYAIPPIVLITMIFLIVIIFWKRNVKRRTSQGNRRIYYYCENPLKSRQIKPLTETNNLTYVDLSLNQNPLGNIDHQVYNSESIYVKETAVK